MSPRRRLLGEALRPSVPAQRRRSLIDRAADETAAAPAATPSTAPPAARRKRKPRFVL